MPSFVSVQHSTVVNNRLIQRAKKGWIAAGAARYTVLLSVLLLPAAAILVWLAVSSQLWWWLLPLAGLLVALPLVHRLSTNERRAQHHAVERHRLAQLALALLREPLENGDLPSQLSQHVPPLFPGGWVEVRLLPDTVLFAQGEGWIPLPNEQWVTLLEDVETAVTLPALPEAIELGFGPQALLLPMRSQTGANIGGIYLLRPGAADIWAWEAAGQSLAELITAELQRTQQVEEALAAQAKAYEEAIYEQAYQAEVNTMLLEYQKVTQEIATARQVQTTFLPPTVPNLSGWQIAVTLEPAREMSGDFYDFIELPNGRIGLVIADVADKGMGSALYMALSRTLIRTFATDFDTAPAQVLRAANQRVLADTSSDLFVTVFYAILEPETGRLTYCNAGHNPPFLYSGNGGGMRLLDRTALPIGILDETAWEQSSIHMQPGDLLVMYTDGVTEAEDESAHFFGEARLQAVATANLGRPVDIIESKVVTAVLDFVGDAPQFDDITLMLLARDA